MTRLNGRPRDGIVFVRNAGTKGPDGTYRDGTGALSVPAFIRRQIPDNAMFRAELTEEGLLYRFLGISDGRGDPALDERPAWTRSS